MNLTHLGIDIGKASFHLVGLDSKGSVVLRKKLSRSRLTAFVANLPPCRIGMEACSGSHHWARTFSALGHEVKLMPARFVVPYRKSNKTDFLDAEAIAEAMTRPTMRFVPIKTEWQQTVQLLHRSRSRCVTQRTALANQIRASLAEFGVVLPAGIHKLRKGLFPALDAAGEAIPPLLRDLIDQQWSLFLALEQHITGIEHTLARLATQSAPCTRLLSVPGIGVLTATALVASVNNGQAFQSGRDLAAWIGLVPKQFSTGGKTRLLGIGKRGHRYLRTLLIHGGRCWFYRLLHTDSPLAAWARDLAQRSHRNVAIVALANKLARIAWAILARNTVYQPAATAP